LRQLRRAKKPDSSVAGYQPPKMMGLPALQRRPTERCPLLNCKLHMPQPCLFPGPTAHSIGLALPLWLDHCRVPHLQRLLVRNRPAPRNWVSPLNAISWVRSSSSKFKLRLKAPAASRPMWKLCAKRGAYGYSHRTRLALSRNSMGQQSASHIRRLHQKAALTTID
jgi:hypothetical protein